MTTTLKIGERIVLCAEGAAPEAEFALFDLGDIELEAAEPGIVREVGYRTTASEAIRRLETAGLTLGLALEAADAMIPNLAASYSRGPTVRRASRLFGPTELFESNAYSGELRRYEGTWLDLPALSLDVEVARATALLQALHLRSLLEELAEDTELALDTRDIGVALRPGQRSYKRMSLEHIASFPAALKAVAEKKRTVPPGVREDGPSRDDLLAALRARVDACSDPATHERLVAIEAALAARERPQRGPLSDPELWALEEKMSTGNASGVVEQLDVLERRRGRDPATSYLRARASLLTGRESPTQVAERASAMAMAMSSFAELELLAAEAWAAAGHLKRAAPFARDLIDTPGADDDLRARAHQILAQARATGVSSIPPAPTTGSSPDLRVNPMVNPLRAPRLDRAERGERVERVDGRAEAAMPRAPSVRPKADSQVPAHGARSNLRRTPPGMLEAADKPSKPPMRHDSDRALISQAPFLELEDTTLNRAGVPTAATEAKVRAATGPWGGSTASPSAPPPAPAAAGGEDAGLSREAKALREARAKPRSSRPPGPVSAPFKNITMPPATDQRRSLLPQTQRSPELMRGASQPPFRADSPAAHMHIPKAPPLPRTAVAELAEDLALPPGLQGQAASAEQIPTSVIDARIHFTFLARELGDIFRTAYGVELRADVAGIEAIQSRLLEDYADGQVHTPEQALDVRRYGAYLSEILARSFGAFWVDIAPADLGYWAMVVPPDTRVWPFGRILRFIAMAHKERDLVAYYLELLARADKT